jgi:hypothetical protein
MKRSYKYLLISLLAISLPKYANGCWVPSNLPAAYYMYRVYEGSMEASSNGEETTSQECTKNCREWQKMTSYSIPLHEIHYVVYSMPLEEMEKIATRRDSTYRNRFLEHITKKDTAIFDFLLLAKTNEYIRAKRNSRWYYPSMKIGARMTLEEIAQVSLSADVPALRERYLLQGIRALFTLARYDECIKIWEEEAKLLPRENLMRRMIEPYIAGARYHMGQLGSDIEYFAQMGDIESMLYCSYLSGERISAVKALTMICECDPNHHNIPKALQKCVRQMEPNLYWDWEHSFTATPEYNDLCSLCDRMIRSSEVTEKAMWYYTRAFLYDLVKDTWMAMRYLKLAEGQKCSQFLKESLKVFRIYLDSKSSTYDSSYEVKLLGQLRWLEDKIVNNIDQNVVLETIDGSKLGRMISYYYWNDMLRRILLAEVCPRMLEMGKTNRALQLANMADNFLPKVVGVKSDLHYSNHFFEMIDSLGLDVAKRYTANIRNPKSEFDRYLNQRGYTDSDYLNDILGTQCLRNLRYSEAVGYLENVSQGYWDSLKVGDHMGSYLNRYEFALEMHMLEKKISMVTNPNIKGKYMYELGIEIRQSFETHWGLTQYYKGTNFLNQVCVKRDWESDKYTSAARKRAQSLIYEALQTVTDPELAADLHYKLNHFRTVARKYPDTTKGRLVRGECDKWVDYDIFNK